MRKELKAMNEKDSDVPNILGPNIDKAGRIESVVEAANFFLDRGAAAGFPESIQNLFVMAWMYGYVKGVLKGHVFKDVKGALELWKEEKINVYVLSSGQVHTQQLLFAHSTEGPLVALIKQFYDANKFSGKRDQVTYKAIAKKIGIEPSHMLYLTDDFHEAEAADEAGCTVVLVIRSGNRPLPSEALDKYQSIKSFEEIKFKN